MMSFTQTNSDGRSRIIGIATIFIILCIIGASLVYFHTKHHKSAASSTTYGCVATELNAGSKGFCVTDAQTMVDFIETDGLNECSFKNGKPLTINGTYDEVTAQQITSVQNWVNCYNHQEGEHTTVPTDGAINQSTWVALCTYGYQYPNENSASTSPYTKAAIAAGNNADCKSLL